MPPKILNLLNAEFANQHPVGVLGGYKEDTFTGFYPIALVFTVITVFLLPAVYKISSKAHIHKADFISFIL